MSDVIDISRDAETGEITQFTVIRDDGQPDLVKATPVNMLLYDPENELPFENGLSDFVTGDKAVVLSDDPDVVVAPTNNDHCYILRVRGKTVETTPNEAKAVLEGVKDSAIDGDVSTIISVYDDIISNQVRRSVVNALKRTFDEAERISIVDRGWLIDDFYLVNWEASMYVKHDDPDEADVKRGGGGVVEVEKDYEFVQLQLNREIEPVEVTIGGERFRLTEREMLFLSKVKWLLGRRDYYPDMPFWKWTDKYASVDHVTGEPLEEDDDSDDRPDLDAF